MHGLFCGERKATRYRRATMLWPCAKPVRRRLSLGNTRVTLAYRRSAYVTQSRDYSSPTDSLAAPMTSAPLAVRWHYSARSSTFDTAPLSLTDIKVSQPRVLEAPSWYGQDSCHRAPRTHAGNDAKPTARLSKAKKHKTSQLRNFIPHTLARAVAKRCRLF